MLTDIEELVLKCRTERAREHISEAVTAYRSGAYRAAIVSCWIAVVFDIVDKVHELAISGDAKAKVTASKLEGYLEQLELGNEQGIRDALLFERTILATASSDYQLLTAQQLTDLRRLQEDRNRCAHPTFNSSDSVYRPSAELARLHISNAILHLLSQPPVQGKAAADRIERTVLSEYFPKDAAGAKEALAETELSRPTEALVRLLVDRLLFGAFENGPHRMRRQSMQALDAVVALCPAHAEPRLRSQFVKILRNIDDNDLGIVVGIMNRFKSLPSALTEPQLAKVRSYVENRQPVTPVVIKWALAVPLLSESATKRINSADVAEVAKIGEKHALKELLPRALELMKQAKSWDTANTLVPTVILPMADKLSAEQIESILAATEYADLLGSRGFHALIAHLNKGHPALDQKAFNALLKKHDLERFVDSSKDDENDEDDET